MTIGNGFVELVGGQVPVGVADAVIEVLAPLGGRRHDIAAEDVLHGQKCDKIKS